MNTRNNTRNRPPAQTMPARVENPDTSAIIKEINDRRRNFAALLPAAFGPDKLVSLVLGAFRKNPAILRCTQESILKSVFECAKLGLEPDTPAGLCYLVPYKSECTFVLGYQGAKVLAMRDGRIAKIWAEHRHARDHWLMVRGTAPRLEHTPAEGDRGEYLGTYAVAEYTDPRIAPSFEFVHVDDMDRIEAHSHGCTVERLDEVRAAAAADFGKSQKPWIKWRDRQRLKTAIKRLGKQLTMFDQVGHDLRRAYELDDLADSRKTQVHMTTVPPRDARGAEEAALGSVTIPGLPDGADDVPKEPEHRPAIDVPADDKPAAAPAPASPPISEDDAATIAKLAANVAEDYPEHAGAAAKIAADPSLPPGDRIAKLRALVRKIEGGPPDDGGQLPIGGGA